MRYLLSSIAAGTFLALPLAALAAPIGTNAECTERRLFCVSPADSPVHGVIGFRTEAAEGGATIAEAEFSGFRDSFTITLRSRRAGFSAFDFIGMLSSITSATLEGGSEMMGSGARERQSSMMERLRSRLLGYTGEAANSAAEGVLGVDGPVVPEPGTAAMMMLGLVGLSVVGRRRVAA
jgi:hypothetical protein